MVLALLSGCSNQSTEQSQTENPLMGIETPVKQEPVTAAPETEDSSDAYEEELSYFYGLDTPTTLDQRFSYAYGYMLMESAKKDLPSIDATYFLRGIYDSGIDETELLSSGERNTAFYEFQTKLVNEATQQLQELASKNLAEAESFLKINAEKSDIITTGSGLQYQVITPSEGDTPREGDSVQVNYKLTFLDGREGDSSVPGIPSTFSLNSLIAGFKEGLMLMSEGSTYRFFVHPSIGYGESGNTRIEPNTLLIFDVDLVSIIRNQ